MEIIRAEGLGYKYHDTDEEGLWALLRWICRLLEGNLLKQFRKIHLAKHFNALLLPTSGKMWVGGMLTVKKKIIGKFTNWRGWSFKTLITVGHRGGRCAFGPENLGLPSEEIRQGWQRLWGVGMSAYRLHASSFGGQKQE